MSDQDEERPQGLVARFDEDLGQLVLGDGIPTGAAGGVDVSPAPGILCTLDAVAGTIFEIVAQGGGDRGDEIGREAQEIFAWLVGDEMAARVDEVISSGRELKLTVGQRSRVVLHRLALLEEAADTDPLSPSSPLWDAEGALIAHDGGLTLLARNYAVTAAEPFAEVLSRTPVLLADDQLRQSARIVASLAEVAVPHAVDEIRRLLTSVLPVEDIEAAMTPRERRPVTHGRRRRLAMRSRSGIGVPKFHLSPTIDALLVPRCTFLFAEDPRDDLLVGTESGNLLVTARLDPRASGPTVESCHARLVDPARHSVVASGAFRLRPDDATLATARMELGPVVPASLTVEVVAEENEPVRGTSLQHLRRALRLGAAALRSERRPPVLHLDWDDTKWSDQAEKLWLAVAAQWAEASDHVRAAIANELSGRSRPPTEEWAVPLCRRSEATRGAFLAERLSFALSADSAPSF